MVQALTPTPMNDSRLGALIREIDPQAEGQPGAWQFEYGGRTLVCLTDEKADRMRVMSDVGRADLSDTEELIRCLSANFERALDARYCLRGGVLWSAFIHPLGSLDDDLLREAVRQVATPADNHGSTYSSRFYWFSMR